MTGMDDLVTWLRAQLDDDHDAAQVADALVASPWTSVGLTVLCGEGLPVAEDRSAEPAVATHIARWDPARVLAEVDAKRQRLDIILSELADDASDETAQHRLRLEALPYAGQPGYREEWRPSASS